MILIQTLSIKTIELYQYIQRYPNKINQTNLHWARVVGYGPFSLRVIYMDGLCPSSGDINRPMVMMLTQMK
jgi:hypothetical protein